MDEVHPQLLEPEILRSYPKIYNLGHRYIAELFDGPVTIQEKIDGSQISWGVNDDQLMIRSKKAIIDLDDPPALFAPSVESIRRMYESDLLVPGAIYRGEAMRGPKHNALEYKREPKGNIVLFDIDRPNEIEGRVDAVITGGIAFDLGVEVVRTISDREFVDNPDDLQKLLESESQLGGMMEGIVIKNYNRWSPLDGKMLMGKLVASKFREIHSKVWGKAGKSHVEIASRIGAKYGTQQRWEKALQHLREQDLIEDAPQDIGKLIGEVRRDVLEECADDIKDDLFKEFERKIMGGLTSGLPEWYKASLVERQFSG